MNAEVSDLIAEEETHLLNENRNSSRAPPSTSTRGFWAAVVVTLAAGALGYAAFSSAYPAPSSASSTEDSSASTSQLSVGKSESANREQIYGIKNIPDPGTGFDASTNSYVSAHLEFAATNSYTSSTGYPGRLYGFLNPKHVVEPHTSTTLTASSDTHTLETCSWNIKDELAGVANDAYASQRGLDLMQTDSADYSGVSISTVLGAPGKYTVTLECVTTDNISIKRVAEIPCLYVRRELRQLSESDRELFLDTVYTLSQVHTTEGQLKYGTQYMCLTDLIKEHLDAAGARKLDKLHDGMGVVTQHVALSAQFEIVLQTVDPSISLPYWDYTIDAEIARSQGKPDSTIFTEGELFTSTWFGASDSDHHILDGRWSKQTIDVANVSTDSVYSSYGYLRAPWNLNPSPYVSRYHKTCGMSLERVYDVDQKDLTDFKWPGCAAHYALEFSDDYSSYYKWTWHTSYIPHGPVHAWIGGVYGPECDENMDKVAGLIGERSAAFGRNVLFALLKNMWRYELVEVPKYCSIDAASDCKLHCTKIARPKFMEEFTNFFIDNAINLVARPELDQVADLMICENTYWPGDHLEAASPVETSFWPIHPTLDRLFQFKQLVKPFQTMDWIEEDGKLCTSSGSTKCEGHSPDDLTFFYMTSYDEESKSFSKKYYTNMEVRSILDVSKYSATYIYNDFEWEHCAGTGFDFGHSLHHVHG